MMKQVNPGKAVKGLAAMAVALLFAVGWAAPAAAEDGQVLTLSDLDPGTVASLPRPSNLSASPQVVYSGGSESSGSTVVSSTGSYPSATSYGTAGSYPAPAASGLVVQDPTIYCRASDGSLYPCPTQPTTVTGGDSGVVYSEPYASYPSTGGTVVYDTGSYAAPETTVYYDSSPSVVYYDDSYDNSWPVGFGLSWFGGYGGWDDGWGWRGGYRPYHRPPPPPPPPHRRPDWRRPDWRGQHDGIRPGRPDGIHRSPRPGGDFHPGRSPAGVPRIERGSRPRFDGGQSFRPSRSGGDKKIFPRQRGGGGGGHGRRN